MSGSLEKQVAVLECPGEGLRGHGCQEQGGETAMPGERVHCWAVRNSRKSLSGILTSYFFL